MSLGEYGALIASGVMTAEEAFELVRKRGIFMQEAVPAGGAMAAVLGLDAAAIEQICRDTAEQTGSEVSHSQLQLPRTDRYFRSGGSSASGRRNM